LFPKPCCFIGSAASRCSGRTIVDIRTLIPSTSPFAFVSERGGSLSPDMIARIVERAGEAAKLGFHIHPHMLRHATGYALANEGTDTRLIQDFLGHASIADTVRYTKLAPGRLATVRVR
jgi:site-specific recombinase XerD